MDNNKFIGFTLIMLLILTYYTFFPPGQIDNNEYVDEADKTPTQVEEIDKINNIRIPPQEFINNKNEEIIILENDDLKIEFSTMGGKIQNVFLKKYLNKEDDYVNLYNGSNGNIFISVNGEENIDLNNINFEYQLRNNGDKKSVLFTSTSTKNKKISISYEIDNYGYLINSSLFFNEKFINYKNLDIVWENKLSYQESNLVNENNNTVLNYYDENENLNYSSYYSTIDEKIEVKDKILWISQNQQFFNSSIISDNGLYNSVLNSEILDDENFVRKFTISSNIPIINNSSNIKYFFGPNKISDLENIAKDFDKNLYLGYEWMGVRAFNKYLMIPIFNFLENITNSYGLIILLLVILIRLAVTPLTIKSHLSMAKMKVLNPEVVEIRKKHEGDMQKSQSELMNLYQKTGVSPLGGCLPILFQMPVLIGMFWLLPNMIELRGKSFLWANDLSNYDSILNLPFNIPFYGDHISLFTILMTVSTILINKANSQMQTMEGPMKTLQYVLPIMFLFIFNNFSSGLTYYYFLSNVASYAQINIFKRFVDEEKIRKEIELNKKRSQNTKKSSFQIRLDEAMKARQKNNKK